MIDQKETTIDYDAILGDFDGFLKERNWEGCNAIIDNLRDLGEYDKGIELAKRLTARKMTVPANYGEEECCGKCEFDRKAFGSPNWVCMKCSCHKNTVPADYGEEKKTFMPCLVKDRENGGEKEVVIEGVW